MTAKNYRKRLGQPVPRSLPRDGGCLAAGAGVAFAAVAALTLPDLPFGLRGLLSAMALMVLAPIFALFMRALTVWRLLRAVRRAWPEKSGLVVTSNSPVWEDHIRTHWLPRMREDLVVLNYSQRHTWGDSLEAKLWRAACRDHPDFVPSVILFRATPAPLVYGFYRWFDAAKRGHPAGLIALENDLFERVARSSPGRALTRPPKG